MPIWFLYVDFVLKLIIQFLHVSFGQKLNCHQTYKQATFIITKLTLTFFLTSWNVQENNKRKKRKAENNLWEYFLKGNLAQLVKTDLHLALLYIYPGLCGRKKCVPDFWIQNCLPEVNFWKTLLTISESTIRSALALVLALPTDHPHPGFQPNLGFDVYRECSCPCVCPFPMLYCLTAGLQVVVRDTQAVPGELFFVLRKPPRHGVLLKDAAGSPGPMLAGSCTHSPRLARETFCSTVLYISEKAWVSVFLWCVMRKDLLLSLSHWPRH